MNYENYAKYGYFLSSLGEWPLVGFITLALIFAVVTTLAIVSVKNALISKKSGWWVLCATLIFADVFAVVAMRDMYSFYQLYLADMFGGDIIKGSYDIFKNALGGLFK